MTPTSCQVKFNKWSRIIIFMSELDKIRQYTKLYSIGLLPKIEGRYLTSSIPKKRRLQKMGRQSEFNMQDARQRLNCELKKIELSQRIMDQSLRNKKNLICQTEPSERTANQSQTRTIQVRSIEMQLSMVHNFNRKATSLHQRISAPHRSPKSRSPANACLFFTPPSENPPKELKIKFSKQPLCENYISQEEQGQASINKWMQSINIQTQHNFNSEINLRQEDLILQRYEEMKQMKYRKIKITRLDKSKR